MSLRYLVSPSGGLTYHLIARRRSRTLWRSFRANVRAWLAPWLLGAARELIVFGPSAGWTLPLEDFAGFQSLILVEPDPLARALLRRRLRASGVQLSQVKFLPRADLLPWSSRESGEFSKFLSAHPSASVLFANVLGQVALHRSSSSLALSDELRSEFLRALKGRSWASYHDLFSGSSLESRSLADSSLPSSVLLDNSDSVASRVFTQGDVVDHETNWLSQGRTTQLALWPLTESSLHIIGFVSESPPVDHQLNKANH